MHRSEFWRQTLGLILFVSGGVFSLGLLGVVVFGPSSFMLTEENPCSLKLTDRNPAQLSFTYNLLSSSTLLRRVVTWRKSTARVHIQRRPSDGLHRTTQQSRGDQTTVSTGQQQQQHVCFHSYALSAKFQYQFLNEMKGSRNAAPSITLLKMLKVKTLDIIHNNTSVKQHIFIHRA